MFRCIRGPPGFTCNAELETSNPARTGTVHYRKSACSGKVAEEKAAKAALAVALAEPAPPAGLGLGSGLGSSKAQQPGSSHKRQATMQGCGMEVVTAAQHRTVTRYLTIYFFKNNVAMQQQQSPCNLTVFTY